MIFIAQNVYKQIVVADDFSRCRTVSTVETTQVMTAYCRVYHYVTCGPTA